MGGERVNRYVPRRTGLAVTAAVLTLGLTACGGSQHAAAKSAKASASPKASPLSPLAALTKAFGRKSTVRSAKGTLDLQVTPSAAVEADPNAPYTPEPEITGTSELGWDPSVQGLDYEVDPGTGDDPTDFQARIVGGSEYLYAGDPPKGSGVHAHWVKVDLDAAEKFALAGSPSGEAGSGPNSDASPFDQLDALLKSPAIDDEGPQTVDGVATESYEGTLTLAQMRKGAATNPQLKQLVAQSKKIGLKSERYEVWIDQRTQLPVKVINWTFTAKTTIDMTIDYSHYSTKPSTIKAPAPEDTMTLQQFANAAGGASA